MHITSIKISDEDWVFLEKYHIHKKEVFDMGIAEKRSEILATAYADMAKLQEKVYTLQEKICTLERESIYKTEKVYTIEAVLKEFKDQQRGSFGDAQNRIWLKPRVQRLRSDGFSESLDRVLVLCKNGGKNES